MTIPAQDWGQVNLLPFEIDGDRITFRWNSDVPLPAQRNNELSFRYEGLELSAFSPELFAEVFLAMQLRAFKRVPGSLRLEMPMPVPATTAQFWKTYHGTLNVEIEPLSNRTTYDSRSSAASRAGRHFPVAIYFGGGRDSLSTACILGEIYGRENVLLITFINPSPAFSEARLSERFENLMLEPARKLGFPVQRISTDLLAKVHPLPNDPALPHREQFTAGALPVLIAHNISISTFCLAWTDYWTLTDSLGKKNYYNVRSRPDWLNMQSRHFERTLGFSHTVANLNLALTPSISVRILGNRYQEAMTSILMCHKTRQPNNRGCHNCQKCFSWLQLCLAEGGKNRDFDFNRMLAHSPWLLSILERSSQIKTVQPNGNLSWQPWLHTPDYHPSFSRLMWKSDPSLIAGQISTESAINLMLMQSFYGNSPVAEVDCIPQISIDTLPNAVQQPFMEIVSQYARIEPHFDHVIAVGGNQLTFDLGSWPNPLSQLAHLQDSANNAPVTWESNRALIRNEPSANGS